MRIDAALDLQEKAHQQEILKYTYTIWRMKFQEKSKHRIQNEVAQMKNSIVGEGIRTLSDGVLFVLSYLREAINEMVFELFVRSVNTANHKKQNSLIIFILNMRDFKNTRLELLLILVEVYMRMRGIAKQFIPQYSSQHKRMLAQINGDEGRLDSKANEDNFSRLDQIPNPEVFRDNINRWIEGTLATCLNKYSENPNEKNRDFLFLYRLLTIAYRIKYPLRGRSLNPDVDIKVYLEHKICSALRKVMLADQELVVGGKPF